MKNGLLAALGLVMGISSGGFGDSIDEPDHRDADAERRCQEQWQQRVDCFGRQVHEQADKPQCPDCARNPRSIACCSLCARNAVFRLGQCRV